jgi:hypothetical protein
MHTTQFDDSIEQQRPHNNLAQTLHLNLDSTRRAQRDTHTHTHTHTLTQPRQEHTMTCLFPIELSLLTTSITTNYTALQVRALSLQKTHSFLFVSPKS